MASAISRQNANEKGPKDCAETRVTIREASGLTRLVEPDPVRVPVLLRVPYILQACRRPQQHSLENSDTPLQPLASCDLFSHPQWPFLLHLLLGLESFVP